MEYTIVSALVAFALIYAALRQKIQLAPLLLASAISLSFQLVFDNLMTAAGLWSFSRSHTLGIFLPFIPLENLAFGLSLMLATIILWESKAEA
ncbi:MAG: lycopene cyclase domain-containing protein [Candidatus Micrarchaeota archaeon]|nr:lycopene cyclase domain-containing protein [Candidatus Micrarchaeota archaeon]